MNQDIKKNEKIKVLAIIIGCILIVILGCSIVRKVIKPRQLLNQGELNTPIDKNLKIDNEVAVNVLYSFFKRGIEEGHMPSLDEIRIDKVFYKETDSSKLVCASYHPFFSNGNNPTWETCLKTDDGSKISKDYDSMNYVSVLTEAALLYKMILEDDQTFELTSSVVEEKLNKKIKELPFDKKDDNSSNEKDKDDKKNNLDIPMA